MSYCRFGFDSDVYVFHSVRGYLVCCGCRLRNDMTDERMYTRRSALLHLEKHKNAGHNVPEYAIRRLEREISNGENEVR